MGRLRSLLTSGSSVVGDREDASTMHTSRSTASLDMEARDQTDQILKLLTDLSEERKKTGKLQQQLHQSLSLNTETRAAAALKVEEERRLRLEAEVKYKDAKGRSIDAQMKLIGLQTEKETLEVELMEAAAQLLQQQSLQKTFQEGMEGGQIAWQLLQERSEEHTRLQAQLKKSESQRLELLEVVEDMRKETQQWEQLSNLLRETSPEPLLIKEDSDVATNPDHLFDSASEAVTRQNSEKTVKVQEPEVHETIHVPEQGPQATPEQVEVVAEEGQKKGPEKVVFENDPTPTKVEQSIPAIKVTPITPDQSAERNSEETPSVSSDDDDLELNAGSGLVTVGDFIAHAQRSQPVET